MKIVKNLSNRFILSFSVAILLLLAVTSTVNYAYAKSCSGNNDCGGAEKYCVQKSCVECRNPGQKNDCNGGKVCSQNHKCVAPTAAPPPATQPPAVTNPPSTGNGNVCSADNADIILVIDTSNSMQGSNLQSAKKAAIDLVNIVSKNPKMRIGVASFDNHGRLNQPLSGTASTVIASINAMKTGGKNGTCLECALRQKGNSDVLNAFATAGQNGNKRHVIILTDGKINFYQKPDGSVDGKPGDNQEEKKARDQALSAIADISQNQGAAFWIVQYGTQANKDWLDTIVNTYNGKGKYFFAPNLSNVDVIYKQIANEMLGGTLVAHVYDDINGNGKVDPDEANLPNVDVTLADPAGDKTVKTDAEGNATFTQLCATTYKVKVTPPDGYQPSPPNSNEKDVQVPLGETKKEDFGMIKPTAISFDFSFALHGIGLAGDNVLPRPSACQNRTATNAACLSNQAPRHPQRDIVIDLLDSTNKTVASLSSKIIYDNAAGIFKGVGKIETGVQQGSYTFKARTPMFLTKKIAFTQPVKPGESYTLPLTDLTSSDVDNDNELSILDYNMIVACYTYIDQPAVCNQTKSDAVDTNDDGIVNEFDLNLFVRDLSSRIGD